MIVALALALLFAVALTLIVVGILRLVRIARALKARLDGYGDLAILAYVDRTQVRVTRAVRRLETAATLSYRARAAAADIASARIRLAAILRSPTALLRLATVLVTGR